MKKIFLQIILFLVLSASSIAYGARIYVKQNASGLNNGTSWSNAYTSIEQSFSSAVVGDEIWIASGIYKPSGNTSSSSFTIPNGIKVYGGFGGTESDLSQRNLSVNTTTLNGDVGTTGVATDNCRSIVKFTNVSSLTRLDGFRIINGYNYTPGGGITDGGGGIRIVNSSPTIANCSFLVNYAYMRGGAIYQQDGGTISILNCDFSNNSTGNDVNSIGGAIFFNSGTLTIKECKFTSNTSIRGGGMGTIGTAVTMDRTIFSGNSTSSQNGGAIYIGDLSSYNIYNSLFVGNVAKTTGAAIYFSSTFNEKNQKFYSCTFSGNKNQGSSNTATVHGNPYTKFLNCIFWDNVGNEQIYKNNLVYKPVVNSCIVETGYIPDSIANIKTSNPKFILQGSSSNAPFSVNGYDYNIQNNSPAVNSGAYFTSIYSNYNLDLVGQQRLKFGEIDIGAYESNSDLNLFYTVYTFDEPFENSTIIGNAITYPKDSIAKVQCIPNSCYTFKYWQDGDSLNIVSTSNPYIFRIYKNTNLIAILERKTYSISLSPNSNTYGTVSGSGNFNCDSVITVKAKVKSGYKFINWKEGTNIVSTDSSYTFTVNSNRNLVANFSLLTNIKQSSILEEIKLFPNPVVDILHVEVYSKQNTNITFNIVDIKGSLIDTKNNAVVTGKNIFNINVNDYAKGLYLLNLIDETGTTNYKFTLE
ncbi:MAG TPA: T9SS type A sorting domain-containing protein [Chitinophagales bacterium]|nr:T9SS type A sorting domain-containing protein [Chitinophagales bacterium]